MCFIDFEYQLLSDFHIFMDIFLFYSLLEGLRTSLQDYHKIICVILHFGRIFKHVKLFQIIIFENPYVQRVVGWATMPCLLKLKNLFKHVHE